jgi:tRNA 2-thiocytidine biosynthesis protein TtcA
VTKIALGHHRDDIIETLFLNMFFGGKLKAMPPKLRSSCGRHMVIRPLAYVPEQQIERYARARNFPLIPCSLCGSQPNLQRMEVKRMLREWEQRYPGRSEAIFSSVRNVVPSHLADPSVFDFAAAEVCDHNDDPVTAGAFTGGAAVIPPLISDAADTSGMELDDLA